MEARRTRLLGSMEMVERAHCATIHQASADRLKHFWPLQTPFSAGPRANKVTVCARFQIKLNAAIKTKFLIKFGRLMFPFFAYQNLKNLSFFFKTLSLKNCNSPVWSLRMVRPCGHPFCSLGTITQLRMFSDQQQDFDGYSIRGDIAFPNGLDGRKGEPKALKIAFF